MILQTFINFYLKIFFILTPFFVLSAFISLTRGFDDVEKKRTAMIGPGETKSWSLSVCLGTDAQPFKGEDRPEVD